VNCRFLICGVNGLPESALAEALAPINIFISEANTVDVNVTFWNA
jgi:hypothetical protein